MPIKTINAQIKTIVTIVEVFGPSFGGSMKGSGAGSAKVIENSFWPMLLATNKVIAISTSDSCTNEILSWVTNVWSSSACKGETSNLSLDSPGLRDRLSKFQLI